MPTKHWVSPIPRSIKANMVERYIFNFKIKPDDLARHLPVPWLEPQVVNGWSAVSFCILWLERLTVAPFPPIIRFDTISCAYRIGVVDKSGDAAEPSVYVTDRYADLPIIARIAPWLLLDTIPIVKAAIGHVGDGTTHVQMSHLDGKHLFSADTRPKASFTSEIFESIDDFADFIKKGVSSYAPSLYPNRYAKVDLFKEDVSYEALEAEIEHNALAHEWLDASLTLDSVVRAKGAEYKWVYRGLWNASR